MTGPNGPVICTGRSGLVNRLSLRQRYVQLLSQPHDLVPVVVDDRDALFHPALLGLEAALARDQDLVDSRLLLRTLDLADARVDLVLEGLQVLEEADVDGDDRGRVVELAGREVLVAGNQAGPDRAQHLDSQLQGVALVATAHVLHGAPLLRAGAAEVARVVARLTVVVEQHAVGDLAAGQQRTDARPGVGGRRHVDKQRVLLARRHADGERVGAQHTLGAAPGRRDGSGASKRQADHVILDDLIDKVAEGAGMGALVHRGGRDAGNLRLLDDHLRGVHGHFLAQAPVGVDRDRRRRLLDDGHFAILVYGAAKRADSQVVVDIERQVAGAVRIVAVQAGEDQGIGYRRGFGLAGARGGKEVHGKLAKLVDTELWHLESSLIA